MSDYPDKLAALQEQIRTTASLKVKGGGSKTALSHSATIDLSKLSGILEYDPQEYTFTALAGTPLAEIEKLLASEGQYLPFDPVLVEAGSTLGGAIASGLSGSGRYRYGGIRDFLLGVRFFTSSASLHTGGAKVIKNASGFDIPKLMVGSLGRLGILTEATLKVFPKPEVFSSLILDTGSLAKSLNILEKLATTSFELSCLDFDPDGKLYLRFGGLEKARPLRLERIQAFLGLEAKILSEAEDEHFWRTAREFGWLAKGYKLVKIPLHPGLIGRLEQDLRQDLPRRYSVGGNLLYLGYPEHADQGYLDTLLAEKGLSGLALTGTWLSPQLGKKADEVLLQRFASVLDAKAKFLQGI